MNIRIKLLGMALVATVLLVGAAWAQPVLTFNPSAKEAPVGIAVDKVGNIWVSLQPICQVRRYTPDWHETLRVDLSGNQCVNGAGSSGIALDATGTAYVAAIGGPNIRGIYEIQPWGAFRKLPGSGQMVYPNSIVFDHNKGTMYVTDMILGAVWRIPHGGEPELWSTDPALVGVPAWPGGPPVGANGIGLYHENLIVSVSFPARLLKIPIRINGSAGPVEMLVSNATLTAAGIFALDDIALDVHGNIYTTSPAPFVVSRISPDGKEISKVAGREQGLTASVVTLAFGTGKGNRKTIFVGYNQSFGGTGCGIVAIDAGVPGLPLP